MKKPTFFLKFWTMEDFDGKRRLKGDQFWPCETLVSFRRPTFWPRTNDQLFKYTYFLIIWTICPNTGGFLFCFQIINFYVLLWLFFIVIIFCGDFYQGCCQQNLKIQYYSINFLCAVSKESQNSINHCKNDFNQIRNFLNV